MREFITLWTRAFVIVTCTALNVTNVAGQHWIAAFFSGGLLSFVWWGNTRQANTSHTWWAAHAYAFGAACGTVFGMWIGRAVGPWL